ncbi:MAG TPA: hypothetical protein VKR22_06575, partial [Acidimicrobiales bacterium]|nr:hypothetical protein [Acidimicrobiales bacterium]
GRVPSLAPVLAFGRAGHREWVERLFGRHLAGIAGAGRETIILQLVCATDVYTWQILRRDQRLSCRRVTEIMTGMVEAIIAAPSTRWRHG